MDGIKIESSARTTPPICTLLSRSCSRTKASTTVTSEKRAVTAPPSEAAPPSNERGLQGVAGNPHQVLIQRWIPPSSPPLEKVGRSETNELLQRLTNLFIPAEMRGWVIPNCRDPPLKARAFCPSQEGDFRRKQ